MRKRRPRRCEPAPASVPPGAAAAADCAVHGPPSPGRPPAAGMQRWPWTPCAAIRARTASVAGWRRAAASARLRIQPQGARRGNRSWLLALRDLEADAAIPDEVACGAEHGLAADLE